MARMISRAASHRVVTLVVASFGCIFSAGSAFAQNPFDAGTPAESKGGLSGHSTYAKDKVETVNLANGNLNLHIPLVTVGGRGAASYTIALNHNSKLWASLKDRETREGGPGILDHYTATYDDLTARTPNTIYLGSGWSILKAPAIKVRAVQIISHSPAGCPSVQGTFYKYAFTRVTFVQADGSEIELRDEVSDGAPYLLPTPCTSQADRPRGRVWHSTDGSAITYITDVEDGVVSGQLGGYVFLSDGTRLRMVDQQLGGSARCTRITDPNGNWLRVNYMSGGVVTYTDQLGRQVVLQGGTEGATVTIKGYDGLADRSFTIVTGQVAPSDNVSAAPNLRIDYQNASQWPRPFTSGDLFNSFDSGVSQHALYGNTPHTDLIYEPDPDPSSINNSDLWAGETIISSSLVSVVTHLNLLDGRSFRFRYNPWGEVSEIVYPGGGRTEIDYDAFGSGVCEAGPLAPMLNRRVVGRRVYSDGVSLEATWSYARTNATPNPYVTVEARQGNGTGPLLMSEKHYFLALDAQFGSCRQGTHNPKFENAREFKVERQTGSGLQTEVRTWANTAQVWGPDPGSSTNNYAQLHGQENGPNNPRVTIEDTTLENGKLKRVRYSYDEFNNVTRVREYDFGAGTEGVLLRDTTRTYLEDQNGYCYTNLNGFDSSCGPGVATDGAGTTDPVPVIHRRRLLLTETVKDGVGNVEAHTEFEYDNYLDDGGNHAPIQFNPGMIQYDAMWFVPFVSQSQPRGNVTSMKRLLTGSPPPGSGTYVTAFTQYDEAGNVVKTKDPLGQSTTISYADNFGDGSNPDSGTTEPSGLTYAFATSATNALGHASKTQYHYSRGVPTGVKDPNGTIAKTEYNDPYDRPTRVTAAYGLPEATKTEMSYPTVSLNQTAVSKQLDATRWLAFKTTYDQMGRPLIASESEDGSATFTIFSKRIYDGLGRVKFVTNPYRATSASTDGWTRATFDLAGRPTEVATFSRGPNDPPPDTGGSGVAGWTGGVTTAYASEATTVTDQAGKKRRSIVDGLGRLVRVDEPNGTGNLDNTANPPQPVQPTHYGYDARGNLKTVTQGTQPARTFSYDLLSRLTSASNPESGTINYTYDANSNLKTKQSARLITTTYEYDDLNRVISRTYSSHPENTPAVSYKYDNQPLPSGAPSFIQGSSTGRLVAVTYGAGSAGSYTGYDKLGRATSSFQQTDSQNYGFSYGYNLASEMTSQTYPSGRVVQTEYDAAGRLAGVKNQATGLFWAGATATDAVNRIQYSAHGAVLVTKLGNGKWEHTNFNSRLQPLQIGLGTSATNSSLLQLDYGYGTTNNNGNVLTQSIGIGATVMSQSYGYDALSRLSSATESGAWSQTYDCDRYGNRAVRSTSYIPSPTLTPQSANSTDFAAFNQSTNRLALGGFGYDTAGNLTSDPTTAANAMVYDAENRQISYTKAGVTTTYSYDGDGHRVKKVDSTGTFIFVYNAGGRLIAEYNSDPVPPPAGGGGTSYLTSDHLGSTRVVTSAADAGGNVTVKARYDYLPFGEELGAGVGARTTGMGYSLADSTKQKFTQKERDSESGLDYFLARYYSSAQGRFTSPDPLYLELRRLSDPQQLNIYSYVRNNPLKYIDPLGLDVAVTGTQQDEYIKRLQQKVSFQVRINSRTHKVEIVGKDGKALTQKQLGELGKTLSGGEAKLFTAITDTAHHATINTGDGKPNASVFFGEQQRRGTNALDFSDIKLLDDAKNAGGLTGADVVAHETLEAYLTSAGQSLRDAHGLANNPFGGLIAPGEPGNETSGQRRLSNSQGLVTGTVGNYAIMGRPGVFARIAVEFVTPIPRSGVVTREAHVKSVEKVTR